MTMENETYRNHQLDSETDSEDCLRNNRPNLLWLQSTAANRRLRPGCSSHMGNSFSWVKI